MPYLPFNLNYGLVAIYNVTRKSPIHETKAPPDFNWGSIYQISWYGIPPYFAVGQTVLFKGGDAVCILPYQHEQYPIIEYAKLVTTTEF